MHILPPVDPLFRVGELALAYDSDSDLAILIAREITNQDEEAEQLEDEQAGEPEPNAEAERRGRKPAWCASGARARSCAPCAAGAWRWLPSGRPICPYCGQPMDPDGHFCPKRNGHKH